MTDRLNNYYISHIKIFQTKINAAMTKIHRFQVHLKQVFRGLFILVIVCVWGGAEEVSHNF